MASTKQLYMQQPAQLEERTRPNLEKPLSELLESGAEVTVVDKSLPFSLSLIVTLT
jgi:ubiquitin-activating enzyme E1 C